MSKVICVWCDWLTKLTLLSQPMRSKTQTQSWFVLTYFPDLYPGFMHFVAYGTRRVLGKSRLLWFCFHDIQLKTALWQWTDEIYANISSFTGITSSQDYHAALLRVSGSSTDKVLHQYHIFHWFRKSRSSLNLISCFFFFFFFLQMLKLR